MTSSQRAPAIPPELDAELYAQLRGLAVGALRGERRSHTLQPTALLHEAFLRLSGQRTPWRSRGHFLGVAAHMMRRVLVDYARRRGSAKRPEGRLRVTLSDLETPGDAQDVDLLDLEAALERLAEHDPRAARVFELRGLAGCTAAEAAEALEVSEATIKRDWRMARSWLRRELTETAGVRRPRRADG